MQRELPLLHADVDVLPTPGDGAGLQCRKDADGGHESTAQVANGTMTFRIVTGIFQRDCKS